MELALYFPFNILCDGHFFMGEKNQPCKSKKGRSLESMVANYCFFFHNWSSGLFFGTTHDININYLKKKKKKNWSAINFIIKIIPPIINLLSYFWVIPIGCA
jgi:hypothetical protein